MAKNTAKSWTFKAENNSQTLPKQVQNNYMKKSRKRFLIIFLWILTFFDRIISFWDFDQNVRHLDQNVLDFDQNILDLDRNIWYFLPKSLRLRTFLRFTTNISELSDSYQIFWNYGQNTWNFDLHFSGFRPKYSNFRQ